jgi:polyphosphate kinase
LLQSDGRYIRHPDAVTKPFSAHHFFMTNPSLSGRGSALEDSAVQDTVRHMWKDQ